MNTDAIVISVKGDLKPVALRHHVFEMGNTLGICGFLNYRNGMYELLIHAEGENNRLTEFTNRIHQLVNEHKLICSTEAVAFEDFTDFKISYLDVNLHRNLALTIKSLNPDIINIPVAEEQFTETVEHEPIITHNKRRKSGFRELFPFLKHTGLW